MAPRVKYIDAYDSLDLIKKDKEELEAQLPDKMAQVSQQLALAKQPTTKYSMNDALVTGAASIIPMILGAALAGKKGAGYGATAGAAGATNLLSNLTANKQAENDLAAAQAKLSMDDYKSTQKRAQELGDTYNKSGIDLSVKAENAADTESRFNRHEAGLNTRHKEALANKGKKEEDSTTPIPPEAVAEVAARTGRPVDEVLREVNLPDKQFKKLNTFKYAEGGNIRPVTTETENKIASAKLFKSTMADLKNLASSFDETKTPGVLRSLKAGKASQGYSDPSSPEYKYYALLATAQKAYALSKEPGGRLTDQDVAMFSPLFEGSPVYDTKATILERLDKISSEADRNLFNTVDAAAASGRQVAGIKKFVGSDSASTDKSKVQPNPENYDFTSEAGKRQFLNDMIAYNAD